MAGVGQTGDGDVLEGVFRVGITEAEVGWREVDGQVFQHQLVNRRYAGLGELGAGLVCVDAGIGAFWGTGLGTRAYGDAVTAHWTDLIAGVGQDGDGDGAVAPAITPAMGNGDVVASVGGQGQGAKPLVCVSRSIYCQASAGFLHQRPQGDSAGAMVPEEEGTGFGIFFTCHELANAMFSIFANSATNVELCLEVHHWLAVVGSGDQYGQAGRLALGVPGAG